LRHAVCDFKNCPDLLSSVTSNTLHEVDVLFGVNPPLVVDAPLALDRAHFHKECVSPEMNNVACVVLHTFYPLAQGGWGVVMFGAQYCAIARLIVVQETYCVTNRNGTRVLGRRSGPLAFLHAKNFLDIVQKRLEFRDAAWHLKPSGVDYGEDATEAELAERGGTLRANHARCARGRHTIVDIGGRCSPKIQLYEKLI